MSTEVHGLRCMETPCAPCQIEDVLSEHRAMVSGDDDGWHVICSCGHNEVGFGVNAHLADALADVLAARDRRVRGGLSRDAIANAVTEHADHMETYTLPALQPGFLDGWRHALHLLRRDAGFIADRANRLEEPHD